MRTDYQDKIIIRSLINIYIFYNVPFNKNDKSSIAPSGYKGGRRNKETLLEPALLAQLINQKTQCQLSLKLEKY